MVHIKDNFLTVCADQAIDLVVNLKSHRWVLVDRLEPWLGIKICRQPLTDRIE